MVGNLDGVRALGRRREPRRGEKMELAPVHKAVNVAGLEFADEFLFDLKPIEGDLFLGLDWLQLEFIRDQNRQITKLRLLGKPGWEEFLDRDK